MWGTWGRRLLDDRPCEVDFRKDQEGRRLDRVRRNGRTTLVRALLQRASGKKPGCRLSVEGVVDLVMPVLRVYRDEFPTVKIGDIEPSGVAYQPEWQSEM